MAKAACDECGCAFEECECESGEKKRLIRRDELVAEIKQMLLKELDQPRPPLKTMLDRRNIILESLRAQFRTKVSAVVFASNKDMGPVPLGPMVERLLTDMANNIAQALGGDE